MSRRDEYLNSAALQGVDNDYYYCWIYVGLQEEVGGPEWFVEPIRQHAEDVREWMEEYRDMMAETMRGFSLELHGFYVRIADRLSRGESMWPRDLETLKWEVDRLQETREDTFLEQVRLDVHDELHARNQEPGDMEYRVRIPKLTGAELEAFLADFKQSS